MQHHDYCPNCDHRFIIEEDGNRYVIKDGRTFRIVSECPNCHIDLIVIDGELREDKEDYNI